MNDSILLGWFRSETTKYYFVEWENQKSESLELRSCLWSLRKVSLVSGNFEILIPKFTVPHTHTIFCWSRARASDALKTRFAVTPMSHAGCYGWIRHRSARSHLLELLALFTSWRNWVPKKWFRYHENGIKTDSLLPNRSLLIISNDTGNINNIREL